MTECAFGACMKTEREKRQGVCGLPGFCVKLAFCVTLPVFCFLWTTSRFEAATSRSKTTRRSTLQVLPVACVAKRSWRFGWGSARERLSGEGKRSIGKPLMFAAFSLVHARAPPKKRELSGRYYCVNIPVTIMHKKVRLVNFAFFFRHICRTTVFWDPEILLP